MMKRVCALLTALVMVLCTVSVLAETVFAWPGVGRLVVDAIDQRDIPTVTGALVMTTMLVTVVNLLIDIVYAFVDPRIKAKYSK